MHKEVSSQQPDERARLALKKTLAIVTGKWRLQIIYLLAERTHRYGDLRRAMPQISEKVLMTELNELVALGFVQKEAFPERSPRVEYRLTPKAQTILPVLDRLVLAVEAFLT
ncbi:winged helix-turn-helix transcriptional regulator [Spirosoma jeollabukense]